MIQDFTLREGAALYGLLAEGDGDIVLKLDRDGLVVHASAGIERLGISLADMLIAPHLADLADPDQAQALRSFIEVVMRGGSAAGWFEFAARGADGATGWFTLQLRPLKAGDGTIDGAIGIMRSIAERRELEERLFAATLTDPLTGLANRRAFRTMLRHLSVHRPGGALALFDIGHLHSLWLRHGASAGDSIVAAFANLLRGLLHKDHILARVGDERFGVLMPQETPAAAEALAREIVGELKRATRLAGSEAIDLRASVGIAGIDESADESLRRAEFALVHARARGRGQIERGDILMDQRRRA